MSKTVADRLLSLATHYKVQQELQPGHWGLKVGPKVVTSANPILQAWHEL